MAIEGRNEVVRLVLERANYGFCHEVIGDVRSEAGAWRINNVPLDETVSAMLKGFNGTAAVRIIVVPVEADYRVADNTLAQGKFQAALK